MELWALIEPLLLRYALPELLELLVKAGLLSTFQAIGITDVVSLKHMLSSAKIVYQYPVGINGQFQTNPPSQSNIEVSQPT